MIIEITSWLLTNQLLQKRRKVFEQAVSGAMAVGSAMDEWGSILFLFYFGVGMGVGYVPKGDDRWQWIWMAANHGRNINSNFKFQA